MNVIWYFYCYSFLGYLLELIYARASRSRKPDRKCRLLLPICPVYGLGATAIVTLPPAIIAAPLLLYPAAAFLATGAEYLAAVFYEKVWHVRFWDYREVPGNLHGRVCLPFFVVWGALAIPLCYWVHPAIAGLVSLLPNVLLLPLTLVFLIDFALTWHILRITENTDALRWYRE